jgi:hypothetical protein
MFAAIIFIVAVMMAMSSNGSTVQETPYDYSYYKVMSYHELWDFPNSCEKADRQLAILKRLQAYKNFSADPDLLNKEDQDYNGRLKATIWWYAYRCDKS